MKEMHKETSTSLSTQFLSQTNQVFSITFVSNAIHLTSFTQTWRQSLMLYLKDGSQILKKDFLSSQTLT
jgi:hypothetical protein